MQSRSLEEHFARRRCASAGRLVTPAGRRRGFTLAEMVVSMGALAALGAGLAVTIHVTARATKTSNLPASDVVNGSLAVHDMAADLRFATSFSERTATAVAFKVADRNGDGNEETIRYSWSGVAGDPVTRQQNGGAAVTVIPAAESFALGYRVHTRTETVEQNGSTVPSGEVLLASFESWPEVSATNVGFSLLTGYIFSEYFEFDWLENVTAIDVTRVELRMSQVSSLGSFTLGIYPAAGGTGPLPGALPLGTELSLSASSLPSTTEWVSFDMNDVSATDANSGYNIVVTGVTYGARIEYLRSSSAPLDVPVGKYSTDSGLSWTPSNNYAYDAPFRVYGTYTTSDPEPQEVERYFVRNVTIGLQSTAQPASRVDTAVDIVNGPEVDSL